MPRPPSVHRRLLELARDSRLSLTLTILAGFLGGLLVIWQAFLLSQVIARVFLQAQPLAAVFVLLQWILAVILLRAACAWGGAVAANAVAVHVKSDLRQRLFAHLLRLGPAYARGERSGELAHAAVQGVEALEAYFSQYLPQLVVSALVPLSILILVFPLDPLSGFVLLLTAPLIPVFMILIGKAGEALTRRQFESLSRLSAHFLDSLQGLTTLKLFGRARAHAGTIEQVNTHFRDTTLAVLRVTFLSALALELIATLSTAIVAVEVGLRLLYGGMAFQEALFLLVIAPEFYIPMRMLGQRYHAGMSGVTAARRIFAILDTPVPASTVHRPGPALSDVDGSIVFQRVSFTYPGAETPALDDIDLSIEAGEHVALVGASGAGKSTLASLLLRFAEPGSGRICMAGLDLAGTDPDEWRRQIAWVPQTPHLFHESIAANLRLANPAASDEQLRAAARAAHLDDFIESLPDGYETLVGEDGARLSGGERQRLALARAFLKDAPVLVLDEPSSSLDPRHEALLEDSLRNLMRGRSVLTIAHRLNSVYRADRIFVLDAGRLVESGTHDELLALHGRYAAMVATLAGGEDARQSPPTVHAPASMVDAPPSTVRGLPSQTYAPRSILLRLLSFLRGAWWKVAASVLLGAATIASSVALMGTSAYLISAAALHPSIAELAVAIVGVRFFGIARGVFRYLERLVSHQVTFHLLARLRTWFYTALEPLAPARLLEYRSGDLLARVVADVEMLENFYVRVVSPPLVALLIAGGCSLVLGLYTASLGWTLLAFQLTLGLALPLLAQRLGRGPGRELLAWRADLHVQLVDAVQGLADLLAFGRQAERDARLRAAGAQDARRQRRMARITALNDALAVLLASLGMWTMLALAIPLVSAGQVPGVMLAALALITLASFEAVTPLPQAAQLLGGSLEAARRLFEVVDARPAVSDPLPAASLVPGPGALSFRDVSFGYGADRSALDRISLRVEPGAALAIVGPSGAGKSTLVNLLLRFWDYEHGEIALDGQELRSRSQDEVRRQLAVVRQDSYFFTATIKQNLLLANPAASQEQLEAAARQAHIHDFISSLPQGYETWVGEQGLRLSGGERQRLAIARALLKPAPLLVLDEPTANLDTITEQGVLQAIFAAMRGRTTLMITHRLVQLERFDEILVLDRGRIVQRGQHHDLLAHDGLYRQMWLLQNRMLLEKLPEPSVG